MPIVTETVVDIKQVIDIYNNLSKSVYKDMDKQYKEKKINGATYATIYSELMKQVINGSLTAVVSLQTKETDMDRKVKQQQIDSSITKTENETCVANANCKLTEAKEKAEKIKNGDVADGNSLYGKNKLMVEKQTALYVRQAKGFDDNARQKYLDTLTGPYSILFQDLDLTEQNRPDCLMADGIDEAAKNVFDNID